MSDERVLVTPPSQQSAQGPVPKPGEPLEHVKGILAEPTQSAGEALEPERKLPPIVPAKVEAEESPKTETKKVHHRTISSTVRRHK